MCCSGWSGRASDCGAAAEHRCAGMTSTTESLHAHPKHLTPAADQNMALQAFSGAAHLDDNYFRVRVSLGKRAPYLL